jgi:hypothetical protein
METADNLGKYMKKLPKEVPSDHFTRMVMDRVMAEAKSSPAVYQPLISRQSWIIAGIGFLLLLLASVLLRSYFPGSEHPSGWISLFQVDYSNVLNPLFNWTASLTKIPVTYFVGLAAFSLLVTADRIFTLYYRK